MRRSLIRVTRNKNVNLFSWWIKAVIVAEGGSESRAGVTIAFGKNLVIFNLQNNWNGSCFVASTYHKNHLGT